MTTYFIKQSKVKHFIIKNNAYVYFIYWTLRVTLIKLNKFF